VHAAALVGVGVDDLLSAELSADPVMVVEGCQQSGI